MATARSTRLLSRIPRSLAVVLAACGLAVGTALAGAPLAAAGPLVPLQPPAPGGTNPCGYDTDTDSLWQQVKGLSPTNQGDPNLIAEVVFPPGHNYGFAMHYGQAKATSQNDFLLVPTKRQRGIECPEIYQPWAINLWGFALEQAQQRIHGSGAIALGINSATQRGKDQLHIHVTKLIDQATKDINAQVNQIPVEHAKWKNSIITVAGHSFRALWVPTPWERNLFEVLHNQIAPTEADMARQVLLVTPGPRGGFIVLNSEPALNNNTGIGNVEVMLNKHA